MSIFVVDQSFFDFDLYNETVKAWDLEFLQLGKGRFRADILQLGDKDLQIGRVQYNKLLLQNGSAPRTGYTFAIHHWESAPFLWRYQDFDFDSIIVFPENRELHGVSQPGHHPFIVTISENLLVESCQAQGLPEPDKFIAKGSVCLCDKRDVAGIRRLLTEMCSYARERKGALLETVMISANKWHLASLLVSSLAEAGSVRHQKRNFQYRKKVVEQAIEFVRSDLSTPRSIQQISKETNVDVRTLRNIFYEHFSLSPQKFFKSLRLNILREALQESDSRHSLISDIANQQGFWHMGQLAKDYYRQFGELPSDTIRRS